MNIWKLVPSQIKCPKCKGQLRLIDVSEETSCEVQCIMCGRFMIVVKPTPEFTVPVYEEGKCRTCGKGDEAGLMIFGFHAGECLTNFRNR